MFMRLALIALPSMELAVAISQHRFDLFNPVAIGMFGQYALLSCLANSTLARRAECSKVLNNSLTVSRYEHLDSGLKKHLECRAIDL